MTSPDPCTPKRPEIEPAFPLDGAPVVLCFDDAFAPHAARPDAARLPHHLEFQE